MGDNTYIPNERDVNFVLFEQLQIQELLKTDKYKEISKEDIEMVLKEASVIATEDLGPINKDGDEIGCKYSDGKVTTPAGFKEAYDKFNELGWGALSHSPDFGGQGMPYVVGLAASEYFSGANQSFAMYIGLTVEAAHVIQNHGTDEMKQTYVEKMYLGQWGGTMCLTEPSAGSAVGDCKSTADPVGDGSYKIKGTKIFISSGDHDMNDNIIHLVLARIKGAPAGIKGISLFVVPKFLVKEDGSVGEYNDVFCSGIEHKMGIKGSATCTLNFGDEDKCIGWLIGEANNGIKYMFQMMNAARMGVGMQAASLASTAYLNALAYTKDRVQGVDITAMKDPNAPRVTIIKHPDIRRMLLTQKSLVEGMRAMLYYAAFHHDLAAVTEDEKKAKQQFGILELLTPICKAYSSVMGFKVTELAIQCYGGYGFTADYPVEQYMRDCKITSIYEGTTGIQAMDLLGRKLGAQGGMVLMNFLGELQKAGKALKDDEELKASLDIYKKGVTAFQNTAMLLGQMAMKKEILYPVSVATPFLIMMGHMVVAWMLLQQVNIVKPRLDEMLAGASDDTAKAKVYENSVDAQYYKGKLEAFKFFVANFVPEMEGIATTIKAEDKSLFNIPDDSF